MKPGCLRLSSRCFVGLLTLAIALPRFLHADPHWRQGGPAGADVRALAVDPTNSDIVYLVSSGGVWKSTDAGTHWFSSSKDLSAFLLRGIAVDPARPNTLYLAGGQGVSRSTDAGGSWQANQEPLLTASYMESVAVDPRDNGIVYRGNQKGLCRSTDRGLTWTDINVGSGLSSVTRILIDPADANRIYAVRTSSGVFRTTDGGTTWAPINTGLPTNSLFGDLALSGNFLYLNAYDKGLFKSTDFGTSWAPVFQGTGYPSFYSVAVHPANPNLVFAGNTDGQVFRSTDGGAHWQGFECMPGTYRLVTCIVAHRENPQTVYAGGAAGFAVSTDGGTHWIKSNSGLAGQDVSAVAIDDQAPLTFYAGTFTDGLWRTTDGGGSWMPIGHNLGGKSVRTILKVPNSNTLYAGIVNIGLWKTTDRGNSWVRVGASVLGNDITQVLISPVDSRLYAFSVGVYASSDSGASWIRRSTGLPDHPIGVLALDPVDPQVIYAGYYNQGMFKTTDGGESWNEIGSFRTSWIRSIFVDPWDDKVVYAGTGGRLYRSTDKGITWTESNPGFHFPSIYCFSVGPGKAILAGTGQGGVFATYDRGETWSEIRPRMPNSASVKALGFSGNEGGMLLAGTEGSGLFMSQYCAANPVYFPQVADGVAGSLKFRSTLVLVNGGDDTEATITFKDATGQPMAISLNDSPAQAVHTVSLKRLESVSFQTPGTDPIKSGYAILTSGPQVSGTVVFSRYDNGICMYESGVPATQPMYDCSIFFDGEEEGRDVGLAVVSAAEDTDAKITYRLFDTAFNQLAVKEISALIPSFGPGHQLARYATEIFPEIKAQGITRGVVTVESDQPIAAVTLRQADSPARAFPEEVPTMCTFPVIDTRAAANQRWGGIQSYFFFPQIANGSLGGAAYQTKLVFLNTGEPNTWVQVEFLGSDGQRLSLPLKGIGERTSFSAFLARGQTFELETTGQGPVAVGYARVLTKPTDVTGTAVFTFSQDGVRLFEAGVPAVVPTRNQSVFLDNLEPGRDIGFALASGFVSPSSDVSFTLTLKLYGSDGVLKAAREIPATIPWLGGWHLAKYAGEVFPEIAEQNIKSGIIAIESQEPVAAVTLRQHRESRPYPQDIYLLTIFPVVPLLP